MNRAIDVDLVRALVAEQFPHWRGLPITQVLPGGWDNRTFRLGNELTVRLPSSEAYVLQVKKEQYWLPLLARQLPVAIPEPVGIGRATERFPYPWSVYRWLPGRAPSADLVAHDVRFAATLGDALAALQRADPSGGPLPGPHNFRRGDSPVVYEAEALRAIDALGDTIDVVGVSEVWEAATSTRWRGEPVWFHGDVSEGNLLVDDGGELAALIDFGTMGIGDPACDLVIGVAAMRGDAREAFREHRALDADAWARARGWAIWKALIVAARLTGSHAPESEARKARRTIDMVLEDHRRAA
ncbi:aminoglycoside phosphotransferase family protein [Sanguibacter sp. HDW7]|uniref:aminoglycoside phosphotransferase family protein n=1 Tax=Sanguibacter sp. HDW7 TaxID=2714931 RepID=UPI00140DA305|nr:aminoglycoside phosphotransferase family protein [Sanguibacter sp. HDW7]QIK83393.1 aminoglycoside phosphotransferase family protein [Sanguibacter sp. HDW7]